MFSDFAISVYFAIGFGGWLFSKSQRRNGNNTVESVVVAVGVSLIVMAIMYSILGLFGDPGGDEFIR